MGVPQNEWTPGADIVNVFIAILIIDFSASSLYDKWGSSANCFEGTHRAINAAG